MQNGEDQKNAITWLHLSDLHFQKSESYDANKVIKPLLRDIEDRIKLDELQPDFIIISGDIAFSGLPDEYEVAGKFLDKLLEYVFSWPASRLAFGDYSIPSVPKLPVLS